MADNNQHTGTQGGTHEQHVRAGQQSHKNTHPENHRSDSDNRSSSDSGKQGGSREQHAEAGRQSHKNS
jgi:general stress protein YciG